MYKKRENYEVPVLAGPSRMSFKPVFMMLASVLAASNAIIIDCSYSTNDWGWGAGFVYACQATVNTLDTNEAITALTDSGATADPALQTSDVKRFQLSNGYDLKIDRLPSNFATIFPNLIMIEWVGSKLRTISPSDLLPYPNLVVFVATANVIRKLDGNLFQNNHQLKYFEFSWNAIQETGAGLLNGLNSLTDVGFSGNPCVGYANPVYIYPPYNTLADVQRELDLVCGPKTRESGPCDPCLANCTSRAAALQIRADAVTQSVYAPWYYKMRAFFKVISMW